LWGNTILSGPLRTRFVTGTNASSNAVVIGAGSQMGDPHGTASPSARTGRTLSGFAACYASDMLLKELFINAIVMADAVPTGLRSTVLKRLGLDLGPETYLGSRTLLKGTKIKTGRGCFINHGCHIDRGQLTLGNLVYVGPGVTFVTQDHKIGHANKRAGANIDKPITVGDGSWIGANATVLGGVNIAEGCIVASGAVVTRDTVANGVYGGVPARLLKSLDAAEL
jgi:maltose O-acetyltransferase